MLTQIEESERMALELLFGDLEQFQRVDKVCSRHCSAMKTLRQIAPWIAALLCAAFLIWLMSNPDSFADLETGDCTLLGLGWCCILNRDTDLSSLEIERYAMKWIGLSAPEAAELFYANAAGDTNPCTQEHKQAVLDHIDRFIAKYQGAA